MHRPTFDKRFEPLESRCVLAAGYFAADFNDDQLANGLDVSLLQSAVIANSAERKFDLDASGAVDAKDVDYLFSEILRTQPGDLDLDRDIDFADFLLLADGFGKSPVGYEAGDVTGDQKVDFDDFLQLSANFQFTGSTFTRTDHTTSGNRYIEGWSTLPQATRLDIPLRIQPAWILGASADESHYWTAVSASGEVQTFEVSADRSVREVDERITLAAGQPPVLETTGTSVQLYRTDTDLPLSPTAPPFPIDHESFAAITTNGELLISKPGTQQVLSINALLDARIVGDGNGRFLVLTDPSTAYAHNVLGDRIEATSITLIDTNTKQANGRPDIRRIPIPAGQVIEGIAPIWTDIDGDGSREIIVTLSNTSNGGQVTGFSEAGEIVVQGPGIGRGFRWRHQIAVAPTRPSSGLDEKQQNEIVDVLTPHIGGTVEFRNPGASDLPIVASTSGYTSHVIRSRNLDMAAISDFDSDGVLEVLIPDQVRTTLAAISRNETGSSVDWELPIGDKMTTNLAVAQSSNGRLQVGVGTDKTLRIWI